MKKFTIIAFVLIICVVVWGMVIWNLVYDNETANHHTPIEESKESGKTVEADLVPSPSEQYYKHGITREDAKFIAPNGEIRVDDLLDIVKEK